jgi:hypothetical protein
MYLTKTLAAVAAIVTMGGCGANDPRGGTGSINPDVPGPTSPTRTYGTPAIAASSAACVTMKGEFDESEWQGLVDSLPQNRVASDVVFALPGALRAQVYETSSWVTVGESAQVRLSPQDDVLSFGGTDYPPDSSGRVTETADYKAARQLFDALVRAQEIGKSQPTVAAGSEETITRTSLNGKVDCVVFRQGVGTPFLREDAYCEFHHLLGASITHDCL